MPVRETYIAVMDFLSNAGGSYQYLDVQTCRDVIDSLFDKRYRLVRDTAGNIISFTSWWMIHEADLDMVKNGGRPADLAGGTIVYIADHAGTGAYPDMIRFIRSEVGIKGVCWHHRSKNPAKFRYYPREEGSHVSQRI